MAFGAIEAVVVLGVIVGVLLRTILPYLIKLKEAAKATPPQAITFAAAYGVSAVIAIILAAFTLLGAVAVVTIPTSIANWQDWIKIFLDGAAFGFVYNSGLNVVVEYMKV